MDQRDTPMRLRHALARSAALFAALALTAACGDPPTASAPLGPPSTTPAIALVSARVRPAETTLPQGDVLPMVALLRTTGGRIIQGRAVTWTSSDPAVAHIDAEGMLTALRPGTVTVVALVEGFRAEGRITVVPPRPPVATVEVTPGRVLLVPGQTAKLEATLRDADGNVLAGREIGWAGGGTSVATVDAAGVVTAHHAGTIEILAWSESQLGRATIVVAPTPPGPRTDG
ncbi:MAG TPA: Ig-like domain-containing protein [Longimicrobium sp.]|nr:Ig-like domain-containing protein [Longimicrobium sp.]